MIRKTRGSGFTLLEILIAIGIMAIGLVTVFALFPIGVWAVKDTVESTRAGGLSRTARAMLTANRADLAITGHNSSRFHEGYVPFGPWEKPWDMRVWREYLDEYIDGAGDPVRRVVFDDQTMVPIEVRGAFDSTATVQLEPASLTRDADLLEHFHDPANPGPNEYWPWDIRIRVRGLEYQVYSRTYDGTNLDTITVSEPIDETGLLPFEILLPVSLKTPPLDVPLEWTGGMATFDGAGGADIWPMENRNLCNYLVAGGWISVGGDWFQIASRSPDPVNHPISLTLAGDGAPFPSGDLPFKVVLPVMDFDPVAVGPDTQSLSVVSVAGAQAGGGAQLGFLEAGAYIEVVLDGARGDFNPENPAGRRMVTGITNVNAETAGFLVEGNFILIGGRHYEIEEGYDAGTGTLGLTGTVPALGDNRYFHIVLGYDPGGPGQLPTVARFPVRAVTRVPTGTGNATRVVGFEVGRDANDNLPVDLWTGAIRLNPVRILPANRSIYSYQVVMNPATPGGDFGGADQFSATGPTWSVTHNTAAMPPIPFPSDIVPDISYRLMSLSEPVAAGEMYYDSVTAIDQRNIELSTPWPHGDRSNWPFHAWDLNHFHEAVLVGEGTFDGATMTVAFTAPNENAIFLAPTVSVEVTDALGGSVITRVAAVDTSLNAFTIEEIGTLTSGEDVEVSIVPAPTPLSAAYGRGSFVQGSSVVRGVYQDTAGAFDGVPGRGLPFVLTSRERYHLSAGDYIQGTDGRWYGVKAIHTADDPAFDFIVLDRPHEGPSTGDYFFRYISPIREAFTAQVSVHRSYRIRPLRDADGARDLAAAFGFDVTGAQDRTRVLLAEPLPPDIRPGQHIRADGDASHPASDPTLDPGVMATQNGGDLIDGDRRWYMIDSIGPAGASPGDPEYRREILLTSPYRGYSPATPVYQPASVSPSVLRTYDTVIGAF